MRTLLLFVLVACGSPGPKPQAPTDQAPPTPAPLTAASCQAQGGKVVGDIGDGAIHRPDYVCPDSGKPPLGAIAADPSGPVAIEGSVCCK